MKIFFTIIGRKKLLDYNWQNILNSNFKHSKLLFCQNHGSKLYTPSILKLFNVKYLEFLCPQVQTILKGQQI